MPRRFPLPLPVRPQVLSRLEARHLAGASPSELRAELEREPDLASVVAHLAQLEPLHLDEGCSASELRGLALAAALTCELDSAEPTGNFEGRRRADQALGVARLCALLARRVPRPLGLPAIEFFCLPLVREVARTRVDLALATPGALARESARLASAWGLSGLAVEVLAAWGPGAQAPTASSAFTALELASRLVEGASGAGRRGDLEGAAAREAARSLGLRPAELAELAEFAVSALAA